ncbi:MAG: NUDIX domain-containing protein [Haloarculaceae archaeon]
MEEIHVVTCLLRNRGDVLLLSRSDQVGSYAGRWGGVAGHAEGDPDAAARQEIAEEAGLADAVTLVRRGESFAVEDTDLETRWVVHPYLFDCDARDVTLNEETTEYAWVPPTEILRRDTVPDLWTTYDRVRSTVETVAGDREHGSAFLSLRALEVLRDEAALAAERGAADWQSLAALARELRGARPTMTVVANRINRAMAGAATDETPAAVERAATEALRTAADADGAAAAAAADRLDGGRIATLSRSGTVETALDRADPAAVLVAESRPGGEGVGVAERLAADGIDVTLVPDAGLAWKLADGEWDAVLVGADSVLADGRLVNKVGTRAAALAGAHEGIDVLAVAATDKISPGTEPHLESGDPAELYDGAADLSVSAPLFDVTPADLLDGLCTEDGVLDADGIESEAAAHRERAGWDE